MRCAKGNTKEFFKGLFRERKENVKARPGLGDFVVMYTDGGEKAEPLRFFPLLLSLSRRRISDLEKTGQTSQRWNQSSG